MIATKLMTSFLSKPAYLAKLWRVGRSHQWSLRRPAVFSAAYAGEGGEGGAGEGGDGGAGEGVTEEDLPESAKGKTSFTQTDLNKILAEDRRKHTAKVEEIKREKEKAINSLEALKKAKGMSDEGKAALQTQIDEMKNSMLTAEQRAEREKKTLQQKYEEDTKKLAGEKETWQNRFIRSTINTAIVSAASMAEAFDPENVVAILGPEVKLVQNKDDDGNDTEEFVPRVKFKDADKDGKPVVIEYTVSEAVNRMKELAKYKHLFKTTAAGGLGGSGGGGGGAGKKGAGKDPKDMTQEEYLDYRKKQGLGRKAAGTK